MDKKCLFCEYYVPAESVLGEIIYPKLYGHCRRYPPQLGEPTDKNPRNYFPLVNDEAWCGEFNLDIQKKEAIKNLKMSNGYRGYKSKKN